MKTPAQTTFTSFKSYVNGKLVAAKLIRADKPGHYWHAKTVQFAANQSLHIRDVYTQRLGGGVAKVGDKVGSYKQVGYILHTGASWHGNIGKSVVTIRFATGQQAAPIKPVPLKDIARKVPGEDTSPADIAKVTSGNVVWSGPCSPMVNGTTLTFVRTNWKPSKKEDIDLNYGYRY
jgi:hypothetical protein